MEPGYNREKLMEETGMETGMAYATVVDEAPKKDQPPFEAA